MKKNKAPQFLLLIALFAFVPATLHAASPWTEKTTWKEKAAAKLDFGFKNTLGGWTEVFQEPMEAKKENGKVPEAIGRGLVHFVADTLGGALHVVTFPITQVDVPLPENGVDLQ